MATGIVALDARMEGFHRVALWLAVVAAAAYAALVGLSAVRVARCRALVRRDLYDARVAFGFFTFVAGTDVLASLLAVTGRLAGAAVLGGVALVAWAALARPVARCAAALDRNARHALARGSWLLATVATQSLSVVATDIAARRHVPALAIAGLVWWLLGIAVYGVLIGSVAARLPRHAGDPGVRPDAWIEMGALAISVLAGAGVAGAPGLAGVRGAVEVVSVALWIVACAWIPVLVTLEIQAALRLGGVLRGGAERWATVFPLGMYAAATLALGERIGWHALATVSRIGFGIALVAWAATAGGLVWGAFRRHG